MNGLGNFGNPVELLSLYRPVFLTFSGIEHYFDRDTSDMQEKLLSKNVGYSRTMGNRIQSFYF